MDVHQNIPLKNYLTMKLGGVTKYMSEVHTPSELAEACRAAKQQGIPFFILGGGSNVIAKDEGFGGLVILNKINGFEVIEDTATHVVLKIGGGENWDSTVAKTVEMNLTGIEAMSGIPGTVGASPVQNIGAYGQEIADTLLSIEAYDSTTDSFVVLQNDQCGFSYRSSIFREVDMGRYGIYTVTLKLYKSAPQAPFYDALQRYFEQNSITMFTPKVVRDAVLAIRHDKLPDPKERPNAGSFFKNSIIEDWQLSELREAWPDMPAYDLGDKRYKVPTGWLIEQAGMKGKLINGIRVHDKNCLVLINESASSYADLAAAKEAIIDAVRDLFRITIIQEPLEI